MFYLKLILPEIIFFFKKKVVYTIKQDGKLYGFIVYREEYSEHIP